jgi:hypothetical protein
MHRATPLGHEQNAPAPNQEQRDKEHRDKEHKEQQPTNPAPAEKPGAEEDSDEKWARRFSVLRGGAPAEHPHRNSGEHRRRLTPVRAVIQPSDPERLRKALDAMREMNKLTRQRTDEMRKLSALSRELSEQMQAFGSVIGGLKIGPKRKSVG